MTKQQNQLNLEARFEASGILESIRIIREQLCEYQQLEKPSSVKYQVSIQVYEFKKRLIAFEKQVEVLIEESKIWEQLEKAD